MPFAVIWANRMPPRVLPSAPKRSAGDRTRPELAHRRGRLVEMISYVAARYFSRPNYLRRGGLPYYSVFGLHVLHPRDWAGEAAEAIRRARVWLKKKDQRLPGEDAPRRRSNP